MSPILKIGMGLIPNRLPGAVGLERICEALPRAPLKKLFEKSFFRIFKNFDAVVDFYFD